MGTGQSLQACPREHLCQVASFRVGESGSGWLVFKSVYVQNTCSLGLLVLQRGGSSQKARARIAT